MPTGLTTGDNVMIKSEVRFSGGDTGQAVSSASTRLSTNSDTP
jgi:hypothetical protein